MPSFDLPLNIDDPSAKILMDAVNYENQTSYDYQDFLFGEPTPASLTNTDVNTVIRITPKAGLLYYNSRDFYYTRMDIGEIYTQSKMPIEVADRVLLSQLIPEINAYYGINLQPGDYVDQTLPVEDPMNPGETLVVALQISASSILFQGVAFIELNQPAPVIEEDRFDRSLYVLVDNEDISIYRNTIVVYDTKFDPVSTFSLMRNCSDVTEFNATKIIALGDGNIVLRGTFKFSSVLSGSLQTYDVRSLVMSPNGTVIKIGSPYLFGPAGVTAWYGHYNDQYRYIVDTANEINTQPTHKTYRYDTNGDLDLGFNFTGLGYVPQCLTTDKIGKIYTASNPYNASGWKIRIDRFLPTGTIDPDYTPIIFGITGTGQPLGIIQMKTNEFNELFVAMRPIVDVSSLNPSPTINGESLIPGGTTQVYGYLPVFKFKQDGTWDKTFVSSKLNNSPVSIYDPAGSSMLPNDAVLSVDNNTVVFYTNVSNPITGFKQRMATAYDKVGSPIRLGGVDYENQVRWETSKQMLGLTNGRAIAFGTGYTRNPSGGWSNLNSLVVAYYKNAAMMRVIHKPTRMSAGPDLLVRDIAITEKEY